MLNRERLIEDVADASTESMDIQALEQYYRDAQIEYMESLTDTELMDHAEIYMNSFEEEDYQLEE